MNLEKILKELYISQYIKDSDLKTLIESEEETSLLNLADKKRKEIYKNYVYFRGLIEFTNHCKNNCFYCGIRKDNTSLKRYRLTNEEILDCCERGYSLGLRTFVLQGGEDPFYTDERICCIISKIKEKFKECAITLSIGEKDKESYLAFFKAGAQRFLLRHETADKNHYKKLHTKEMSFENRKQCLFNLKKIGFATGSGFMVGSPFQTTEGIIKDIRFLQKLKPEMIGIGPFIVHKNTPFKKEKNGSANLTVRLIAILRLLFPKALIPATTALFSLDLNIAKKALQSGANVIMPNITPKKYVKLYSLYNNKIIRPHKTLKNLKKEVYPEDINLKFLEEILKLKIKKNFKIMLINKNKI